MLLAHFGGQDRGKDMNKNWKAFFWGIIVGTILCALYVAWTLATPTYPRQLLEEETQVLKNSIENYNRGITKP